MQSDSYQFTNRWFETARPTWDMLIPQLSPSKILEIGSFEGRSTCYLIDSLGKKKAVEIHCIDTWEGGVEHKDGGFAATVMSDVEQRFHHNTGIAIANSPHRPDLVIHKGNSGTELARLVADGKSDYFDFIYIDGSHQAPDVLADALLGFRLLRIGGVVVFDDYLWSEPLPGGVDPIRCPKVAIDAFTNIYCRKIRILPATLGQLYVEKICN